MNDQQTPSIEMPVHVEVEDIIELLIKKFDINEGYYILNFEMEIAAGQMPLPSTQNISKPSLHLAFKSFSLQQVPENIPNAVNASEVNPKNSEHSI